MEAIFILPLLTAATFHLANRATITEFLWSWYARWPRINRFLSCSACSGFWYGAAWMAFGRELGWTFLGASNWWVIGIVALCSIIWTPIFVALQEAGLHAIVGWAEPDAEYRRNDELNEDHQRERDGGPSWNGR